MASQEEILNGIKKLQVEFKEVSKALPPTTKKYNDAAFSENNWQQLLCRNQEKLPMDIPDKQFLNTIQNKIKNLEQQSQDWVRNNGYQQILDTDAQKQKL